MADDQEKTEEATPERRKKARDEGQFPRGKDAGNTAGSIMVLLTVVAFGDFFRAEIGSFAWLCFHESDFLIRGNISDLLGHLVRVLFFVIAPLSLAAALGAFAVGVAEAGFHPNMDLIAPKWSRLDPLSKLKQMFSPQQATVNVALQLGRVVAVAAVAWFSVAGSLPELLSLSRTGIRGAALQLATSLLKLALWASLALVVLVAVDFLYNRFKHEKQIRMSKQEVKDEYKNQEGDPRVKARQRAKAREMAKRSILQAVQSADFVIANPTHVSVAIRYRPEEGAPVVVAKGFDQVALHIRQLAERFEVPVIENVPLARALARQVKVGRQIPVDLYAAVAEVLALVYRLKNRSLMA